MAAFAWDTSEKTLYFRGYLTTDGSCYWLIVVVGFNGLVTAIATTDKEYLKRQLNDFPQVIKTEAPYNPGCKGLS